jgi:hypothetical protein
LINFDCIPKQISEVILKRYVSYELPKEGTQLQAYLHSKDLNAILARSREIFE